MKFFGYSLTKSSSVELKATSAVSQNGKRRTAKSVIVKQPKREVSFQIADIKSAIVLTKNPWTPDRRKLFEIYDYIVRDGHLKSQVRLAKYKVLSEPWLLYKDGKADEAMTKKVNKRWFNTVIEYILESEFYGFSVVELDDIDAKEGTIGEVEVIDRIYVSIENQWILVDGTVNGSYLPYADIMFEIDLLEFGKRNDLGIFLECAYNVLWKFYARSDWSRANEKFGMPILSITADTTNDSELDAIEQRAANFASDGYIIGQAGDLINIVERKLGDGHVTFKDIIALCNDEVSKIINGQTSSSDQKAFVGAAEVQERVMDDFTLARLEYIADEANEKFLPYLVYKGIIPEGYTINYPEIIRQKLKKLNGPEKKETPAPKPEEEKK